MAKLYESPTEVLIAAMEHVDKMQDVVIIWANKDQSGGMMTNTSVAEAFYMLDFLKSSVFSGMAKSIHSADTDGEEDGEDEEIQNG